MEKRKFGKTGLEVGILGLGAAEVGYNEAGKAVVAKLLDEALELGINVVDTAECYGNGEEVLGQVLKGRKKKPLLFTKCGHRNGYAQPDWDDAALLEKSLELSLKNLGVEAVDLFQLHSCSLEVLKRGEVVEFMERVKAAGKSRFIGYSGDGEAALYAVKSGVFDALQISVSVADQQAVELVLPEAAKRGLGVIAKRPIANAAWRPAEKPNPYHAPYRERLRELDYPFLRGEAAAATALRFTLSSPGVTVAIVGTERPGRLTENASVVAAGPLPAKTYQEIRRRWKELAAPDWVGQS